MGNRSMPEGETGTGLRLRPEHGRGRPIALGDEPITFGRHPDNTFSLKDEKASRFHCVVEPVEGGYQIRDLESRNGTKVNGARIQSVRLHPGDTIQVGKSLFFAEREGAADFDPQLQGEISGAAPVWLLELNRILKELPPAGAGKEEIVLLAADGRPTDVLSAAGDGSRALKYLLRVASKARATDIHIEPKGDAYHTRMRVDGQMVWIAELPIKTGEFVLGIVRAACHMKQAARDAMQEGHFSAKYSGGVLDRRVEFRASLTPSTQGQKAVLRVLDSMNSPHATEELGLLPYMHQRLRRTVRMDAGLVLSCGPTGSGKTTTLYSILREIDRNAKNVVTIEDPVEFQLDGTTQLPVDDQRGKGFGELLRSVLRQDPDVILVGEIRDEETARTAMQAAMTGHLVLSTVHAKDSISAIFRLLDLKVEPYLVANSLDVVIAQRLVRLLCPNCKEEVRLLPGQITKMGKHLGGKTKAYQAVGCKRCLKTGYFGRRAIFELLDFNDDLRDIVLNEPSVQAMKKVIAGGLFTTLAQFGFRLVADGVTSIEEVERVAEEL